mgnify:CR=1 FL=1
MILRKTWLMDVGLFERFYRGFLVSRDKYTRGVGRNYDVECGVVSKLLPTVEWCQF